MTMIMRYPRAAATEARPMPVLPLVGSIITERGVSLPLFFGVVKHRLCYAVLDRACGVKILELGINACMKLQLFSILFSFKMGFCR